MRARHARKPISSALGLVVLGCLWFYFAPVPLGGTASYVVTHGISMEPRFHTGDLAIVRSQSSYHVGEIVAYQNRMLHTIVLHRIIGRDGSRYIFKGDNNNFVDFEHPAASQLIGALWLHVPGVGATLKSIRSPALVGMLVAAGMLCFTAAAFTRRRRRRRRRRHVDGGSEHRPTLSLPRFSEPVIAILALGLVALLPFIVLALLALTRPQMASLPVTSPYTQSGTLTYSAGTAPGPVYPAGRAVTGEPLFTHLVSQVEFRYAYLFHADAAHSLTGKAQLYATAAAPSGWQTTLALGSPTYFHGDYAVVAGSLDLASLSETLRRVATMTEVNSDSYTLTISAHVSATGRLDGQPLHATFSPQSQFSAEEAEIEPPRATGDAAGAGAAAAGSSANQPPSSAAGTNPLAASSSASVTGSRQQARFVSLGPARLSVATARAIALGAIAAILCALLTALAVERRRAPRDEAATIRARYGHLIVPVERVRQLPGVAVIDVADMDALARIAEHYERSILHERTAGGEVFWVTDESGQFRYALAPAAPAVERQGTSARPLAVSPGVVSEEARTAEYAVAGSGPAQETRVGAFGATNDAAFDEVYAGPLGTRGEGPREAVYADELEPQAMGL